MLKLENVSKIYGKNGKKALENVSFDIRKGEFTALLGQNGAGKSTLINILGGNVGKTSGKVLIGKYNLDKQELLTKKIIGIVPQEISFDHFLTVEETLYNQAGYFGIANKKKIIDHLLEKLSLSDKRHTNTKNLSGGMKRRLLIAKALVHQPELLILDEPTAGVDIELRLSMYEFLKELNRQGTTIILTTHYLEEAEKLCEWIIILDNGRKIMDSSKDRIISGQDNSLSIEFQLETSPDISRLNFLREYLPVFGPGNKLKVQTPARNLTEVLKKMETSGIPYSGIRFENKKLEDVFLNLIKKGEINHDNSPVL